MNKMSLIGNLTRDPESRVVRRNDADASVTNFTVAVDTGYGDHKRTDFVRVAAWNGLGMTCAQYLRKGMKVYAEGPVTVNAYVNSEGKAVGQLEMRLDSIEFLSKAGEPAPAAAQETAEEDIEDLL